MTPRPGIEPGPHWWEASALTTAPSLLPIPAIPAPPSLLPARNKSFEDNNTLFVCMLEGLKCAARKTMNPY